MILKSCWIGKMLVELEFEVFVRRFLTWVWERNVFVGNLVNGVLGSWGFWNGIVFILGRVIVWKDDGFIGDRWLFGVRFKDICRISGFFFFFKRGTCSGIFISEGDVGGCNLMSGVVWGGVMFL